MFDSLSSTLAGGCSGKADTWKFIWAARGAPGARPALLRAFPSPSCKPKLPFPRRPPPPAPARTSALITGAFIKTRDLTHAGGAAPDTKAGAGSLGRGATAKNRLQAGGSQLRHGGGKKGEAAATGAQTPAAPPEKTVAARCCGEPRSPFSRALNFPSAASITASLLPRAGGRLAHPARLPGGGSQLLPAAPHPPLNRRGQGRRVPILRCHGALRLAILLSLLLLLLLILGR